MPGRKCANVSGVSIDSHKDNNQEDNEDDNMTYKFVKDEIVWAKMKFFSAWPAKVQYPFQVKGENYKKKKPVAPKIQVQFFDNPPTIGEIHHNQIFKFEKNYRKFAVTSNKKLLLGIKQAKELISQAQRDRIKDIERNEMNWVDSEEEESVEAEQEEPKTPQKEKEVEVVEQPPAIIENQIAEKPDQVQPSADKKIEEVQAEPEPIIEQKEVKIEEKEEKVEEVVVESPLSAKPKRKPKPTYEYEIFLSQQQQNKRQKKLNEKDKEKEIKKVIEEAPKDLNDSVKKLQHSAAQELAGGSGKKKLANVPLPRKDSLTTSKRSSVREPRCDIQRQKSIQQQAQINLQQEQSSQHTTHHVPSQKQINKEKIGKMKEIKKYFDTFFKDMKELNRKILNLNENQEQIPLIKTDVEKQVEADQLQVLIQKAYSKVQLNSHQIDQYISLIFHEYNELSLIHESKLGHSLRDMQQFLEYYQSSDDVIDSILSKLDMIIELQEKKMHIEIFGETPLDCDTIKKHLKCGKLPVSSSPVIKQTDEVSNGTTEKSQKQQKKNKKRKRSDKKSEKGNYMHSMMKNQMNWNMKANFQRQQTQNLLLQQQLAAGLPMQLQQMQMQQLQMMQQSMLPQHQMQQQMHQSNPQNQCNSLNLTILNHGQNFMNLPPQGNQNLPLFLNNNQKKEDIDNVNLLSDAQKSQQFLAQLNLIHQLQNQANPFKKEEESSVQDDLQLVHLAQKQNKQSRPSGEEKQI